MARDDLGRAVTRAVDAPAPEHVEADVDADVDDTSGDEPIHKRKSFRFGVKLLAFIVVVYVFVLPLIPGFRRAAHELGRVQPALLAAGLALEIGAWFCYSMLTRSALGDAEPQISRMRMFRIQSATKALTNVVPGGSAAGSALGYRLLTLSGISGPDAGFALATAGLGSAVVLNVIFWIGLLISIPIRGVNPLYATAALAGVLIMLLVAGLIFGLLHGQGRAERVLRWLARKLRFDPDRASRVLRQIGQRVEDLVADKALLRRVVAWSVAQWLLDAVALWVFLRAFGGTLAPDQLIVAFGLANVIAVVPITPGGLGIVEGVYIPTLVAFDLGRGVATLGVASYRMAQFFLPIPLGGLMYLSLRIGPFRIERRDELQRLRDIARDEDETRETKIDFVLRSARKATDVKELPAVADDGRPGGASSSVEGSWGSEGNGRAGDSADDEDENDRFPHNAS